LRKKLEPSGVRIATVRGLGYCLERPADGRNGINGINGNGDASHAPSKPG
jgi:hypothetical protein